jgi:hypothetical protein
MYVQYKKVDLLVKIFAQYKKIDLHTYSWKSTSKNNLLVNISIKKWSTP